MDADEGSKHNQKFVRKDSQVLTGVGILLMRNEAVWKA